MNQTTTFLLRYGLLGLAAALLVFWLFPDLVRQSPNIVEIHQAPSRSTLPALSGTTLSGPVSYAEAVARAQPAVVNIHTAKVIAREHHPILDDPFFRHLLGGRLESNRRRLETSLGSGVIFSAQGYVVTNHHVVAGADAIRVGLNDGRVARAQLIGTDPDTDIAVLKIPAEHLSAITVGQSDDIRVGDVALAMGNPFGVGQTVTMGIISAKGRNELGINTFEDYIQTDAAINPGNSGGALINAHGELIGINTAIFSKSGGSQGIGFAIPTSLVKQVLAELIQHGRVIRGWLGIETHEMTAELAESAGAHNLEGVLIASIYRDSPAYNAGIRPGDVLLSIDGKSVHSARETLNLIARHQPGTELKLTGTRRGQAFHTSAKVIERPDSAEDSQ